MEAVNDESVSQFLAFTGCADPDVATHYLQASNGVLETAVGLFMDDSATGGVGGGGMNQSTTSSSGINNQSQVPSSLLGPGEVRAPDQTRTERLIDFGGMGGMSSANAASFMPPYMMDDSADHQTSWLMEDSGTATTNQDVRAQINRVADAAMNGVLNNNNNDDDGNEAESNTNTTNETDNNNNNNNEVKTLNDMFAPPTDIIHKAGGFQGARTAAKDSKRWLLVNIQRDAEFACHVLNRDVWRNDLVRNLIQSNFIFWQAWDSSAEGSVYVQRYNVQSYPHIAIIDPRTGRSMWKREGWTMMDPMTERDFAQAAADFCSLNTFDKPPSVNTVRKSKRNLEELSEQEQLEEAIRISQGYNASTANKDSDMTGDDDMDVKKPSSPPKEEKEETAAAATSSQVNPFHEEILGIEIGEEPSEGGARVLIRLPDGSRVKRKFKEDDSVKVIYAFVAQSNEEAKGGKEFELCYGFPPSDLISKADCTIKECSLNGESITTRWK
eukprot:CAMPEP_0178949330 /NCGR_PEP_ID=MMETSP0789-20121207/5978_1 /TAXON_ID=3005 /ORGANISM="Rhizosolenia setigera, Strain CCMP 1694" /LENGTH=497 /DNA_ID=CAMNT_0020629815 /DNA_START=81 /DNA_END=1574 /DNA_ORIENTATION=-